jgi:hypothetical protein
MQCGKEKLYRVPNVNRKMHRLFTEHCSKYRINASSARIIDDEGQRIDPGQKFIELVEGIEAEENGEVVVYIDCLLEMTGGSTSK